MVRFKFMRDELFKALRQELKSNDIFVLLPVYYAGGTSSFSPTSEEVFADYRDRGLANCVYCPDRQTAVAMIREQAGKDDVVLIMGARDNSLSDWAVEIAGSAAV